MLFKYLSIAPLALMWTDMTVVASPAVAHHSNFTASRTHHTHAQRRVRRPSRADPEPGAPTPPPTGTPSPSTTVYIDDEEDFAILLPKVRGSVISDAEGEAVSFCYGSNRCANPLPESFITGAHASNGSAGGLQWIQVTGCIDPSKYGLSYSDGGGQFDVRFPQGAHCTFGGNKASFIEQIEPSASRFCLRCCSEPGEQTNCNSHHDRDGCLVAVPGVYSFENGVSCDS